MSATIWLRPLNDVWQPVATEGHRRIWHEALRASSDQYGPREASFTLKRPPRALFPDLLADTPVMIEVGGVRVWRGRIKDTPETTGADRQVSVSCEGGQYYLDDDAFDRVYVHSKLTEWKDARSFLVQDLARFTSAGQLNTDGGIVLSWAQGTVIPAGGITRVGAILDLGESSTARRVCLDLALSNNSANALVQIFGSPSPLITDAGAEASTTVLNNSGATATLDKTFTAGQRYIIVCLQYTGATTTLTADIWARVTGARVFADTAYESGRQSVLTADDIILDALARGTTQLSDDRSGIDTADFDFPDFRSDGPRSVREWISAANAPHNWRFKIDEDLRPLFRARPTAPILEAGAWEGAESDNGSSNSTEGIATKVIVTGTGADDSKVEVIRTQTGTIVDRQGGVRAKTLDTSFALNDTFAQVLGDTYLEAHRASPYKGQTNVTPGGVRRILGGTPVHPAHLLLYTSELLRLADRVDPDTGALWRSCTIDQVAYDDDALSAEIDLDNTRNDFEALQERLGILAPA